METLMLGQPPRELDHKEPLRRTFLLFLLMARCLRCPSGLCDPFPTMVPWHHNGPDIFDGIEVRVVAGRALLLHAMPLQPSRVPKKIEIAIIPNKPSIFDLKFVFAISDLFFNLRKQKKPPCWLTRPWGMGCPPAEATPCVIETAQPQLPSWGLGEGGGSASTLLPDSPNVPASEQHPPGVTERHPDGQTSGHCGVVAPWWERGYTSRDGQRDVVQAP